MLSLALPLSEKTKAVGFAVMPRGSVLPVANSILRFFFYWRQRQQRTDYDLSALMLDENFQYTGHVSWTRYHDDDGYATYSGDLTEAAAGASEFIDIDLSRVKCRYIISQINIYTGESFEEVEESFFGFMERTPEQKGMPFEARTVRMKSEIRGKGKVALPLVFAKNEDGSWTAKWLHLHLNGKPNCNRVEANRLSTSLLVHTIVCREYLDLGYLIELMRQKAGSFSWYKGQEISGPVVFIGLETPEGLPAGSTAIMLGNLQEIIPA
ncbi:hypothetical protein COY23_03075 [bacterium (Candidatus Torokbacteria) CG_4_10_14_0_2_um_filter_35_8]|nr:MAG: hypothetical protein COY23_03075 [bacterium (Candidatus Torokbacteria) CG_4_10_14_0_2_um_filter_35_8]